MLRSGEVTIANYECIGNFDAFASTHQEVLILLENIVNHCRKNGIRISLPIIVALVAFLPSETIQANSRNQDNPFGRNFISRCEMISDQVERNRCYARAADPEPEPNTGIVSNQVYESEFKPGLDAMEISLAALLAGIGVLLTELLMYGVPIVIIMFMLKHIFDRPN